MGLGVPPRALQIDRRNEDHSLHPMEGGMMLLTVCSSIILPYLLRGQRLSVSRLSLSMRAWRHLKIMIWGPYIVPGSRHAEKDFPVLVDAIKAKITYTSRRCDGTVERLFKSYARAQVRSSTNKSEKA